MAEEEWHLLVLSYGYAILLSEWVPLLIEIGVDELVSPIVMWLARMIIILRVS